MSGFAFLIFMFRNLLTHPVKKNVIKNVSKEFLLCFSILVIFLTHPTVLPRGGPGKPCWICIFTYYCHYNLKCNLFKFLRYSGTIITFIFCLPSPSQEDMSFFSVFLHFPYYFNLFSHQTLRVTSLSKSVPGNTYDR